MSLTCGERIQGAVESSCEGAESLPRNDSRLPRAVTGVEGRSKRPAREQGVARASTPVSHARRRESRGGRSGERGGRESPAQRLPYPTRGDVRRGAVPAASAGGGGFTAATPRFPRVERGGR